MERDPLHGRGAQSNPLNRFEPLHYERDEEAPPDDELIPTQYFVDPTRSIIARNDSPDVGFETSVNPYRGCEHGCVYCFARPTHEYLGLSSGIDFETKIFVKTEAPVLLRKELMAKSWEPQVIVMSGVTDCYQPIERKMQVTRGCLDVLREFRNPVSIITKNALVARDADILGELASMNLSAVYLSVTSLDPDIARKMEPRASTPELRLEAIRKLTAAGVPVGVMVAPIVPGITDHEMPAILRAARDAGAVAASYVVLRLPWAVKELVSEWLDRYFPDRKDKVLNRIRSMRDGKLYDSAWGVRGRGEGFFAEQLGAIFKVASRRAGFTRQIPALSTDKFRRPSSPQMSLFGSD